MSGSTFSSCDGSIGCEVDDDTPRACLRLCSNKFALESSGSPGVTATVSSSMGSSFGCTDSDADVEGELGGESNNSIHGGLVTGCCGC